MSYRPPPQEQPSRDGDDGVWIDLIAGRPRPEANPDTCREAALLRDTLLQSAMVQDTGDEEQVQQRWQQFQQRLQRDRLLVKAPQRPWWPTALAATFALMALLGIWRATLPTLTLPLASDDFYDYPVLRQGGELTAIATADPAAAALALRQDLEALALPYRLTRSGEAGIAVEIYLAAAPAIDKQWRRSLPPAPDLEPTAGWVRFVLTPQEE